MFRRAHALRPTARTLRALAVISYELGEYEQCFTMGNEALASSVRPLGEELRSSLLSLVGRARRDLQERASKQASSTTSPLE